jgi:AraC family transcriptional regulator of adaptative response/methylated-DNA-[protein]-cysteine methyltransferase
MCNTAPFTTDDEKWQAVQTRNSTASGSFFYAVQTTGIFCRPGCASRLPRRKNVEYFSSAIEAEKAGYRPCRRCAPQHPTAESEIEQQIVSICRHIEQSELPPKLRELAAMAGLSQYHFHRLFKKVVGITPKQYAAGQRARRFQTHLLEEKSVTEAIYAAGFNSSSGAYDTRRDQLAMQPRQYTKGGAGVVIHYGITRCSLGWVIVAATERGICAIMFGDEDSALPQLVQDRFPRATLVQAGPEFAQLLADVVRLVDRPSFSCNLPLDIQGTAFQQKVWNVLRQITPGETLTYSEVAERLGTPRAVRAVAGACGANPIAVAIPCHRVIGKDGSLTGYRWGLARKETLLKKEEA